MPPPQALLQKQNNHYGRGPGLNCPGGALPVPQISPMGMSRGGMSQGMSATNMDGQPRMLGPGMKPPPTFGGSGLPINFNAGGQFESPQPVGMTMDGNYDQSFSPQPSPHGSRPNSMTFSDGSRPPSQQLPHNPTRGFTTSNATSNHQDPFDSLASFK